MRKYMRVFTPLLAAALIFTGCSQSASKEVSTDSDGFVISLSDNGITVDGETASTDEGSAVYVGADIVYYEEGQNETYGEGSTEDEHSAEEASQHTVITITQPGTYTVNGSISYGQIAIDLGKDSEEDPNAVVNLILDNAEITCTVAPAIVVYNAYECGDDSEENATPEVDTVAAGFNLILAKDSKNTVNGSYVAKIYKDGTTLEDIENNDAKKKYKFDAAIDSLVSFNMDAEENGTLTVNAENEGISSSLHLTINGGEITINAADDAINTNEDNVSVFTVNDGILTCDSGLGDEGDGVDSNGYIVINGGYIITSANGKSQDSGIDSDKGIYINGGTLLASGNMYDEVSSDSEQSFVVLSFAQTMTESDWIMLTDEEDTPISAFRAVNDYTMVVYSCPELTEGTYHLYQVSSVTGDLNGSIYTNITDYQDAQQLQYTSGSVGGMRGFGGMGGDMRPEGDMERPEGEEFQKPEGAPELPDGEMPEGEAPQRPEGEMEGGEAPDEAPERPDGEIPEGEVPADMEMSQQNSGSGTEFTISSDAFQFGSITTV